MKLALALEATFDSDAGVQQIIKGLGRYLLKEGHDVYFITPYSEGNGEFEGRIISFGRAFEPIFNTTSVPVGIHAPLKELKKAVSYKFDIIHTSLPVSPLSIGKMITLTDTPVIGTYMSHSSNPFHRSLIKSISQFPIDISSHIDAITVPNELTKTDAEFAIPGKYHIIPHATDLEKFCPKVEPLPKFSNSQPKLLFLGRLEFRKGVQHLLTAMPDIIKEIPDILLIIAGDGPRKERLEEKVDQLGIGEHVLFEGYIDEDLKPSYYASADLCVFPATHGESFGIVLAEALASGKIPVAFDNEGYRSVLENIPEALVEKRDTEMLSERIIELLSDNKRRDSIERRCLKESERFTWDVVGPQYLELYRHVLES